MPPAAPSTDDLYLALSDSLDKTQLDRIIAEADYLGAPPQRVLFAGGWLTPHAYTNALARYHGIAVAAPGAPAAVQRCSTMRRAGGLSA